MALWKSSLMDFFLVFIPYMNSGDFIFLSIFCISKSFLRFVLFSSLSLSFGFLSLPLVSALFLIVSFIGGFVGFQLCCRIPNMGVYQESFDG